MNNNLKQQAHSLWNKVNQANNKFLDFMKCNIVRMGYTVNTGILQYIVNFDVVD